MNKKAKYLFFDIECSNGHNICSFGYCLVDEEMRIIEKKDILINPENKFILSPSGKRPKIELAYPEELFYKQNNFAFFYEDIKKLTEDKRYTLLGHSVRSDLFFLEFACKRYNLPRLDIKAYDTQKMFKIIYNRPHVESLENILKQLEVDANSLTFHRSCDDAKATFLVTKEICWQKGISLDKLLAERADCLVSLSDTEIKNKKHNKKAKSKENIKNDNDKQKLSEKRTEFML